MAETNCPYQTIRTDTTLHCKDCRITDYSNCSVYLFKQMQSARQDRMMQGERKGIARMRSNLFKVVSHEEEEQLFIGGGELIR